MQTFILFLIFVNFSCFVCGLIDRPHIILITGDDIGYNDVGWNNERIHTPYMNKLAKNGVILDQYYTFAQCTPSRASLLTGYYSQKLGMQRWVLFPTQPYGLPLRFKMIQTRLVEVGYRTHAVGKWHLGFCDWKYTPTYRDFESFFGFYGGAVEQYQHCIGYLTVKEGEECFGLDFRNGTNVAHEYDGQYAGELFGKRAVDIISNHNKEDGPLFLFMAPTDPHFPLQAPKYFEASCQNSVSEARTKYCASMASFDDQFKNITNALKKKGFYKNSVIIFASDNGGAYHFGGNNYPLRGGKGSLYEGGTRVPAFVHSPLLQKKGYVNKKLIHVTDWYPTILNLAGAEQEEEIDGVDQWKTISEDSSSHRKSLPYAIDEFDDGTIMAAIRDEKYKLIVSPESKYNAVIPENETVDYSYNMTFMTMLVKPGYLPFNFSDLTIKLFDLQNDPSESNNLAAKMPQKLDQMMKLLDEYRKESVPANQYPLDPKGNPKNFNNAFSPGWCSAVEEPEN